MGIFDTAPAKLLRVWHAEHARGKTNGRLKWAQDGKVAPLSLVLVGTSCILFTVGSRYRHNTFFRNIFSTFSSPIYSRSSRCT